MGHLPPTAPIGDLQKQVYTLDFDATVLGSDATWEGIAVPRTGFVTAARLVPSAAAAANGTNFRTWAVVDPTTRSATDGCIVDPAAGQGAYVAATAYTAGQWVSLNNQTFVCISAVTGGTGPGVDVSHWQPIVQAGLNIVNSVTGAFTADDVDKRLSDSGNTDVPATSYIGSVLSGVGCTAAALVDVNGAKVNGTAVVTRTVTIGASRTIASFASTAVSLAGDTEQDLALSGSDTKVFKGDVLKLTSVHTASGVADPGGVLQIEVTVYADQGTT